MTQIFKSEETTSIKLSLIKGDQSFINKRLNLHLYLMSINRKDTCEKKEKEEGRNMIRISIFCPLFIYNFFFVL